MIPRYDVPEVAAVWSDEARMRTGSRSSCSRSRRGPSSAPCRRTTPRSAASARPSRSTTCWSARRSPATTSRPSSTWSPRRSARQGRWIHFGLTSSDVLDTGFALQLRAAADVLLARSRAAARRREAAGARAPGHRLHGRTLPRRARRAHVVRAQARRLRLPARSRSRAAAARPRDGRRRRDQRGRRHVRERRPAGRGDRLRATRPARVEASTQVIQRDRHAEYLAAIALVRVDPRRDRDRDPPPRADGGPRGPGAVRGGAEGLVRDAAQAEPGGERARVSGLARVIRGSRADRARERRALARARHLALLGRARDLPRRHGAARVHASRHDAGSWKGSSCSRSACATNLAVARRDRVQPVRAAGPRRRRARPRRGLPDRPARRGAAWDEDGVPRDRRRPTRRSPRGSTLRRSTRCSTRSGSCVTPVGCSTGSRSSPWRSRDRDAAAARARGKVRDIYDAGEGRLLLVATDRISAFDVVLPDPIPDKGRVLTGLSSFWFDRTADLVPNHVITADVGGSHAPFDADPALAGRAMLVRTADVVPMECVVRGYLSRIGWKQYQATGAVCGIDAAGRARRVRPAARADLHAHHEGGGGPRSAAHARRGRRPRRARAIRTAARPVARDLRADRRARRGARRDRRRHEVRVRLRSTGSSR